MNRAQRRAAASKRNNPKQADTVGKPSAMLAKAAGGGLAIIGARSRV